VPVILRRVIDMDSVFGSWLGCSGPSIGIGVSKDGVHCSEFLQRSAYTSIIARNIWTVGEYGDNQ
jgi:hypothetical protein